MMRSRDSNGQHRQKRGDTYVGNIEKTYDIDFGVRSDMHVETLRKQHGDKSLTQIVKEVREEK